MLVKPLLASAVRSSVASHVGYALIDDFSAQARAGRVVAVAGSPGAGVATVSAAIARRTVRNAGGCVLFGIDPLGPRFAQIVSDAQAVEWVSGGTPLDVPSRGLSLVERPASSVLSLDQLKLLITRCGNSVPAVVLVAGGGCEAAVRSDAFGLADVLVVLVEPSFESVMCASHMLGSVGERAAVFCVLSNARSPRAAVSEAHVRYALGDRDIAARLPHDRAIARSGLDGASKLWLERVAELSNLTGLGAV